MSMHSLMFGSPLYAFFFSRQHLLLQLTCNCKFKKVYVKMFMMTNIPTLHTNIFTVEQMIVMQLFLTLVHSLGIPSLSLSSPMLESHNFMLCIIHILSLIHI